ncbi:DUF7019 family protein [Streptomyces broussonetiae]|uniref:Uncharacterized protein n=1 Tax=Streptomyces broussonetiae TaxID=2686304 RepID=A0A6I6NBG8_9ACTN|nr:SAVMC3_10250 family protein [Streptomyces broussonetiae]QHA08754.1 hypothetical protein GQF42_40755 [Streptomyces broussonetiae]
MSFRHYLYVSDAKVDMLLSRIAPESALMGTAGTSPDPTAVEAGRHVHDGAADRFARLQRVLRHLGDRGDLGEVDGPAPYVHGVLPMQWGPVGDGDTVYFGGYSDRTIVGLGGSTGHVLSAARAETQPAHRPAGSLMPALLHQLAELAAEDTVGPDALGTVVRANSALRGPARRLEFVAQRILHGPCPYPELYPVEERTVLLGSPLYVALAE